jgi:hypothetical protein
VFADEIGEVFEDAGRGETIIVQPEDEFGPVPEGVIHAAGDGASPPEIAVAAQDGGAGEVLADGLGGAVGGAVIDDDGLGPGGDAEFVEPGEAGESGLAPVVDGDDEGRLRVSAQGGRGGV